MSSFTFGNINVASKKHVVNLKTVKEIVLKDKSDGYSSYPFDIVVLADSYYNPSQVRYISLFLEANRITKYKLISSLNCIITKEQIKEDQKSGLIDFYRNNASDFWKEIPDNAVIITAGPALYAITQSDALYPDHMNQRIFGVSNFWYSKEVRNPENIGKGNLKGNWIFPIEGFSEIFAYGFNSGPVDSFKTKLAQFQFKSILGKEWLQPRLPSIKKNFIYTEEEFLKFYEKHKDKKNELLAWDLETSGFDFLKDEIGCISMTFDGREGFYIRWKAVDKKLLNELLKNNKQIGSNLKFDYKFAIKNGLPDARIDEDVIALGHTLDETRSNSLKALAFLYTEFGGYDWELDEYKRKTKIQNYLDIPEEILQEYALMDAIVAWRAFDKMLKHARALDKKYPNEKGTSHGLESYYRNIKIPATNLYAEIEYEGVPLNLERLGAVRQKLLNRIDEVRNDLAESLGVSRMFDFDSSTKLGKLLEELGWEEYGRTKAGHYNCGDPQLIRWAKDHPEAKMIQELRTLNVFLKTFIGSPGGNTGWYSAMKFHPEDNSYRLHARYNAMGTESGRTRCSEPNMMNIPSRGPFAKDIRSAISTPDEENYYILSLDYAALQMRLAALDGDDPSLVPLFKKHREADVHSKTAYNVFARNKQYEIEEIEVEQDGKIYHFLGGQLVKTSNRGEIFARDLEESDVLEMTN